MPVVRRPATILLPMVLLAGLVGLAGCTGDQDEPPAEPVASSTPLADFPTDDVTVARGEFCPRVAPQAVAEALGADPEDDDSWANGDRTRLAAGVRDVAHEYGCSWTAADGTVASAWVFAPPVTPAQAADLRRQARRAEGCDPLRDAAAYGARSTAVSCRDGGAGRTTYQGLFGDAWLTCSLRVAGAAPDPDRTGRWCVAVAQAAS